MEESTQQSTQRKGMPMGVIVVVLIAILAIAGFVYASNNKPQDATKEQAMGTTQTTQTSPAATQATATSPYKDGTYSAVGEYQSPGGEETLEVELTLKDGVITASTVTPQAERPISVKMQNQFVSGYKAEVEGKNIDEVKLDVVSGSSLSPKGFNDAVEKIKQQAQA